MDAVDGKTDDAMHAFEAIKNIVAYWNLALVNMNFKMRSLSSLRMAYKMTVSFGLIDFPEESWRDWKWWSVTRRTRRRQEIFEKKQGLSPKDLSVLLYASGISEW